MTTDGPSATSRGYIVLVEEKCTVCMICAQQCPTWCIHIAGHVDRSAEEHSELASRPGARVQRGGRRRETARPVLDAFVIDYGLCMYCGICVEACPFDALEWSAAYDHADVAREALAHDKDALADPGQRPI